MGGSVRTDAKHDNWKRTTIRTALHTLSPSADPEQGTRPGVPREGKERSAFYRPLVRSSEIRSSVREMNRKKIRLTTVAKNHDMHPDTMRRIARERGMAITRNRDGRTSPDMLYVADVRKYEAERS